ncbi:WD repeat-containing protein 20-like [Nylanderia fulva]|uniref:WD repeat-containing protein 20-like n=1 Tax=Nylanderia fulva TaxID=613905 RepID=UPI0010FB4CFA|nr:WD repeat-containing protein 20-like [Nylanderia fulva]
MAVQLDGGGKEDLKTQFVTREGTYKLMTLSEYSRPNRVGYTNSQGSASVRVSFVTLPDPADPTGSQGLGDRMCFNFGKELYVYVYRGVKKAVDLNKPVDKKLYKGTNPTCHNFNQTTATADSAPLLVGFSTGQIQLIDPIKKELSKLYNEDRLIDKSKVTCIKWVPGSNNLFLVSHSSGQLYLYNEELLCGTTAPHYQSFKSGDGYAIYTCKTKSTRNPLYRWVIGAEGCCINEFAFSPCGTNLAVVSQDGFLRVFQYNTMELVGSARSYFGGFLCVCWSPDGRYVVVGGEDDLVTIWSFHEKRVVARGQGHHSWVSVVAFDPYTTSYGDHDPDFSGSDDETTMPHSNHNHFHEKSHRLSTTSQGGHSNRNSCGSELRMSSGTCYRLGSVSQDTQLCLWDITEDVLRQPVCAKQRSSVAGGTSGTLSSSGTFNSGNGTAATANHHSNSNAKHNNSNNINFKENASGNNENSNNSTSTNAAVATVNSLTQRLAGLGFGERKGDNHKRNFSLTMRGGGTGAAAAAATATNNSTTTVVQNNGGDKASTGNSTNTTSSSLNNSVSASLVGGTGNKKVSSVMDDPMRLIGTAWCPRFDECPVLEPLVCKKLAHERLTELVFREDCFVTACQDGYVYTWARPGHMCNDDQMFKHAMTINLSPNDEMTISPVVPCYMKQAGCARWQFLKLGSSVPIKAGDVCSLLPDKCWFKIISIPDMMEENDQILKRKANENLSNEVDCKKECLSSNVEAIVSPSKTLTDVQSDKDMLNEHQNSSVNDENSEHNDGTVPVLQEIYFASSLEGSNMPATCSKMAPDQEITEPCVKQQNDKKRKAKNINLANKSATDVEAGKKIKLDCNVHFSDQPKIQALPTQNNSHSPVASRQDQTSALNAGRTPREKCMYGGRCYRKNPNHKNNYSHPDDSDYEKIDGREECPYGIKCYRKNPQHKMQFKHTSVPHRRRRAATPMHSAIIDITSDNSSAEESVDESDYEPSVYTESSDDLDDESRSEWEDGTTG